MSDILVIGAGGVGAVVTHKLAEDPSTFDKITLASRTVSKCESIAARVKSMHGKTVDTAEIDADNVAATSALIERVKPKMVINVALPYQDLNIMDACLNTGVHYLDTANYEPRDEAKFEYKWQWAYQERFEKAGLMALLGSGFDPGMTNVFCAYAQKNLFDTIDTIDILDCNGGDHGHPFATNFNPEINIREITQKGKYWEEGKWIEIPAMSEMQVFDFPEVGERDAYLLYHEELESLVLNIKGLKKIRFWMTFGQEYLTHLRVLQNVGMTRIDEVDYFGTPVSPIKFLQKLLPDPASLGKNYKGKTSIGCLIAGEKDGKKLRKFIYNVADHEVAYKETGAQAVSYTTGVPAVTGARMMCKGIWSGAGVFNMEQLDPDPFMNDIGQRGLPWHVQDR